MAQTRGEGIRRRRAEGTSSQVSDEDAVLLQDVHSYKDHAVLLRKYVSKKAAGRGRALLEVLGFDTADIDSFYEDNPRKGENAVQAGLLKWVGRPPPKTWKVLIDAMKDAEIAQQHTEGLKEQLQKEEEPVVVEPTENRRPQLFLPLLVVCTACLLFRYTVDTPSPAHPPFKPTEGPVAVFRVRLQGRYNMTPAPSSLKFLKVPGFKFFQPLIYEAKEVTPDRDAVERLQHGEEPMMEYSRVMQEASRGKLILLEGPPGSGKSTVSRQLSKDWAEGVLGTEFELVVLIPLRKLKKGAKVELKDLLKVAYENLPDGVVQHIEAEDGNGMLFILDGYDEITSQAEGALAVVKSLLDKSYLQHSSVVVTSRGIAAKSLYDNQHLHKRFVIQGLLKVEIPVFVSHYFEGSEENAIKLLNKLNATPRLTAACRNTLALAIVCYLHSKQEIIPTNTTGLYGRFVVISLREFAKRSPEPDKLLKFMKEFDREPLLRYLTSIWHPSSSFSHLSALAKLALDGIIQDKFIFESTDEMVRLFPDEFDGYGLLDSTVITDDYGVDAKLYTLNFLHLTVQEFMAALFVASKTTAEQVAFWRNHLAMKFTGSKDVVKEDRFLTMFAFYCGLTGLENKDFQDYLLEEVHNLWTPCSTVALALVPICNLAAESGNKEFACSLLSPLGKKAEVNVNKQLDSANVAWCITACKENFEELVVTTGSSVHMVADFLGQLNQLTTLSVLDLPNMNCALELSESTCSEDVQTVAGFWRNQEQLKSLKMKLRRSSALMTVDGVPHDLLLHIHEITLEETWPTSELMALLDGLPLLQTLVLDGEPKTALHEEGEDPSVIGAISDAVKRHPNLTEVTVSNKEFVSRSLFIGVVKGVLQKADVQKVDTKKNKDWPLDQAATDDLVQEYLLPAMKGGSLKTLAVMLENISSVESILRELPHTKVEELAVVLMGNPDSKVSHYSLAAATKAGLSESNTLKKFRMELVYPSFPADYILTCINNPLEELELIGFHFSYPGLLADCADHLHKLSLQRVILFDVSGITPSDIAAVLVGGLGQNGTLEELVVIYPQSRKGQVIVNQPHQDVEDEETLQAVEAAVRESTSVKRIIVQCEYLNWTNVATAILKGAAENRSLRVLTMQTSNGAPPQDVVDEVRQKRRWLVLGINALWYVVQVGGDVRYTECTPYLCHIKCIYWTNWC